MGTIPVAVFAAKSLGGNEYGIEGFSTGGQLTTQLLASLYTVVYTAIVTFVILKLVDVVLGLRVDEREEEMGLDTCDHGETGYNS